MSFLDKLKSEFSSVWSSEKTQEIIQTVSKEINTTKDIVQKAGKDLKDKISTTMDNVEHEDGVHYFGVESEDDSGDSLNSSDSSNNPFKQNIIHDLEYSDELEESHIKPDYGGILNNSHVQNPLYGEQKSIESFVQALTKEAINDCHTNVQDYPKQIQQMTVNDLLGDDFSHHYSNQEVEDGFTFIDKTQQETHEKETEELKEGVISKYFEKLKSLNRTQLVDFILKLVGIQNESAKDKTIKGLLRKQFTSLSTSSLVVIAFYLSRVLFRAYGMKFLIISGLISHFAFSSIRGLFKDDEKTDAGVHRRKAEEFLKAIKEMDENDGKDND